MPPNAGDTLVARIRGRVVEVVRSGPRTVVLTAFPGPRLGNVLYFWLQAHRRSRPGRPWLVQVPPEVVPWLDDLPALRDWSVERPATRDRRTWPPPRLWQRFGEDFTRADVDAFVRETILDSPLLRDAPAAPAGRVVVNVRRGDYYSDPKHRAHYAMDIPAYVREGLRRCAARAPIGSILVVSDDPAWCATHLADLGADHGAEVRIAPRATPAEHFVTLATAERLVGANSTFSYWAGHVLTTRLAGSGHVVMPRFHARHVGDGRADQLDPSWDVVEELPGGWADPGD